MVKILVANQNVEQNTKLCQYLANDNNLKIIGTNDGISTLEQYHKICIVDVLKTVTLVLTSIFV